MLKLAVAVCRVAEIARMLPRELQQLVNAGADPASVPDQQPSAVSGYSMRTPAYVCEKNSTHDFVFLSRSTSARLRQSSSTARLSSPVPRNRSSQASVQSSPSPSPAQKSLSASASTPLLTAAASNDSPANANANGNGNLTPRAAQQQSPTAESKHLLHSPVSTPASPEDKLGSSQPLPSTGKGSSSKQAWSSPDNAPRFVKPKNRSASDLSGCCIAVCEF